VHDENFKAIGLVTELRHTANQRGVGQGGRSVAGRVILQGRRLTEDSSSHRADRDVDVINCDRNADLIAQLHGKLSGIQTNFAEGIAGLSHRPDPTIDLHADELTLRQLAVSDGAGRGGISTGNKVRGRLQERLALILTLDAARHEGQCIGRSRVEGFRVLLQGLDDATPELFVVN
jgi:hypothetical protein